MKLIVPDKKYLESYVEAFEEYKKYHIKSYSFEDVGEYDIFEKFENYRSDKNLKPNRVPSDHFWLVDDDKKLFIGEISIRHRLNDELLRYGGHIGYGIRYSHWNKGYGSLMLKLALEKAKELGIERVLITCDDDNIPSAKVMENNGFELQDKVENPRGEKTIITRRYWKTI